MIEYDKRFDGPRMRVSLTNNVDINTFPRFIIIILKLEVFFPVCGILDTSKRGTSLGVTYLASWLDNFPSWLRRARPQVASFLIIVQTEIWYSGVCHLLHLVYSTGVDKTLFSNQLNVLRGTNIIKRSRSKVTYGTISTYTPR